MDGSSKAKSILTKEHRRIVKFCLTFTYITHRECISVWVKKSSSWIWVLRESTVSPFSFLDLEYDNFKELYTAIRNKEVTYGLLNADIAAYQQLDWNEGIPAEQHLAVIQVVPMSVSVSAGMYLEWQDEYMDCTMKHWNKAQRNSIEKFRRKAEVGITIL